MGLNVKKTVMNSVGTRNKINKIRFWNLNSLGKDFDHYLCFYKIHGCFDDKRPLRKIPQTEMKVRHYSLNWHSFWENNYCFSLIRYLLFTFNLFERRMEPSKLFFKQDCFISEENYPGTSGNILSSPRFCVL